MLGHAKLSIKYAANMIKSITSCRAINTSRYNVSIYAKLEITTYKINN